MSIPDNKISSIVSQMKGGMSTAKILIALFQSQLILSKASINHEVLYQDVLAASTHSKIPPIAYIVDLLNTVQEGADKLAANKQSQTIGQEFGKRAGDLRDKVTSLEDDKNKLEEEYKAIRDLQKALIKMMNDGNIPSGEVSRLTTLTATFIKNVVKNAEHYQSLQSTIKSLRGEVSRYTELPEPTAQQAIPTSHHQ